MSAAGPSLLTLFLASALAAVAGYFLRIVQKIEDRRDNVHMKVLPALYANLYTFSEAVTIFLQSDPIESGRIFARFVQKTKDVATNLNNIVFSGDILLMRDDIRKQLLNFYTSMERLEELMEEIQNNVENIRSFQNAFEDGSDFLGLNPKRLVEKANEIAGITQSRLSSYKSFSFRLVILIFALAGVIAVMNLIGK
jgi:methyl-accepting chemotaxis protein